MPKKGSKKSVQRGEAGRRGDDVRSDAYVSVEIKSSGGVKTEMTSKVAAFYGRSIEETVAAVLSDLKIKHAVVEISDAGALPFVMSARVEAAARRAGCEGKALPERAVAVQPTDRYRLRRSRLYLPGNEPKFFINAGLHRPDGVILDLEDSVHPDEKNAARILVRNALRCVDFHGAERMVRINQLPLGLSDLDEVVPEAPNLVLIPKVEHAGQVRDVQARIEKLHKSKDAPVWLMPIVESALGVENSFEIAQATESVVAITIGLEDYTADMGVPKTVDGKESLYARSQLANAAHAAGVQAIDSVFGDVGNEEVLRAWGSRSRSLGFEGMGCIHPRQIRPIHESFAPTEAEIEKALKIVVAFEEAEAKGLGVVSLGTRMVDPPVVRRARRLVEQARRAGLVDFEAAGSGGDK